MDDRSGYAAALGVTELLVFTLLLDRIYAIGRTVDDTLTVLPVVSTTMASEMATPSA